MRVTVTGAGGRAAREGGAGVCRRERRCKSRARRGLAARVTARATRGGRGRARAGGAGDGTGDAGATGDARRAARAAQGAAAREYRKGKEREERVPGLCIMVAAGAQWR